ncbi:MAG: alpha/beta hydrolase, partial [Alphaproteobacteria bacterium]
MPGLDEVDVSHLRGASRLAFDATLGIAGMVEQMHRTIQLRPFPIGAASDGGTVGLTGLVYRAVRGGIHVAGSGVDAILGVLADHGPEAEASPLRQAIVSAANGVYGDHLV